MKQNENDQNHKKESTSVVYNKPNGKSQLKDLFTRLPAAKITQTKQFTPAMWVRARTGASLPAEQYLP